MNALPEPAPDFDQPIAVLKHCHDRIRKQIATLQKLGPHLLQHGADQPAQQAAQAVLRYFRQAAPLHHQDEEENLLPMLQATARNDDAAKLMQLLPEILQEHQQMELLWQRLEAQLAAIDAGQAATLSNADVTQFCDMYTDHMGKEETTIAPMAKRLFDQAQMHQLGDAMRARRNLNQQEN
jgi:pyridoxamine 5'-phosphate oxidase